MASSGVVIRRATLDDVPAVVRINRECLPENYPEWFFREHVIHWGDAFIVAEASGRVVGYAMCRAEWGIGVVVRGLVRRGHVVSVAVLPGWRRRGIATAMLREALSALRDRFGCREAYLEVRVSNEPAIRLYEKLGFRRVRRLRMYYADGEDAWLMARGL